LNSDLKMAMLVSEMTPPFRETPALPGEVVPRPEAGDADVHDARTKPATAAATTAADRDLRRSDQATRIPILFLSPATSMPPPPCTDASWHGHGLGKEPAARRRRSAPRQLGRSKQTRYLFR
jgi:hypothetical protein